jgi:PAS domain-containing protein
VKEEQRKKPELISELNILRERIKIFEAAEDDREQTINAASTLSEGMVAITFENRYLCKDGSYKWISWNSYPVVDEGLIFAKQKGVLYDCDVADTCLRLIDEKRFSFEINPAQKECP